MKGFILILRFKQSSWDYSNLVPVIDTPTASDNYVRIAIKQHYGVDYENAKLFPNKTECKKALAEYKSTSHRVRYDFTHEILPVVPGQDIKVQF